ncbi:MAG: RecQ family zinc-binding domain-containing protein [Muribaculaceae bacterium]|nr:RecQ family zinc-binding domain-containing protein [Muribaculaceae bacterium]
MTTRSEAMIDYAFSSEDCRVKRMLSYFGEENPQDCKKCDICRDNKRKSSEKKTDDAEICSHIITYLNEHPQGASLLSIEQNCGRDKKKIASIIGYLCNEGFIIHKNQLYISNR